MIPSDQRPPTSSNWTLERLVIYIYIYIIYIYIYIYKNIETFRVMVAEPLPPLDPPLTFCSVCLCVCVCVFHCLHGRTNHLIASDATERVKNMPSYPLIYPSSTYRSEVWRLPLLLILPWRFRQTYTDRRSCPTVIYQITQFCISSCIMPFYYINFTCGC